MNFTRKCLLAMAVCFTMSNVASTQAGITIYNDQASFLAAIQPGYYLESFDSMAAPGEYPDTMSFSQGGFSYDIFAQGIDDIGGLYALPAEGNPASTDVWLSTTVEATAMTISNLAGGISAIGGNFFITAFEGYTIQALLTVQTTNGVDVVSVPVITNSSANFIGFVTDDGSSLLSFTFEAPGAGEFATMNNVIVGAAVPEPSSIAMMIIGLGALGYSARKRRHATA